jgi:hypothetical protein
MEDVRFITIEREGVKLEAKDSMIRTGSQRWRWRETDSSPRDLGPNTFTFWGAKNVPLKEAIVSPLPGAYYGSSEA